MCRQAKRSEQEAARSVLGLGLSVNRVAILPISCERSLIYLTAQAAYKPLQPQRPFVSMHSLPTPIRQCLTKSAGKANCWSIKAIRCRVLISSHPPKAILALPMRIAFQQGFWSRSMTVVVDLRCLCLHSLQRFSHFARLWEYHL